MPLRSLVAIRAHSNGGYEAKVAFGYEFGTKAELVQSCREIAECLGIAVALTVSNASEVHAEPADSSSCVPTQPHTNDGGLPPPRPGGQASNASRRFDIVAKYVRKDNGWRVVRSTITQSGEKGTARRAHSRRTAYRVVDLARHVEGFIRVEPHARGLPSGLLLMGTCETQAPSRATCFPAFAAKQLRTHLALPTRTADIPQCHKPRWNDGDTKWSSPRFLQLI